MQLPLFSKLFFISLVSACIFTVSCLHLLPTVSRAESIQIFATVAADPEDFQLELTGPDTTNPYGPNSVLTYTLTYGSYLAQPTDVIVLRASWDHDESISNLLEYIEGSATTAIDGSQPVIDSANRTITWQISPMPPGTNHTVSWQLQTTSAQVEENISFSISAMLIGPGIEKPADSLNYSYLYSAPILTPTPTPVSSPQPTATPTIPGGRAPETTPNLLKQLGPLITTIIDIAEDIAEGGGSLVAAPIPVLFILIPAIAQIVTLLGQVPWWQILPLLAALLWSKPRRPWGVVYDSVTKQPIDPAIITLISSTGEKRTTLSDYYGRYQFLVEPGTYELTVQKVHYLFPSQRLQGRTEDSVYTDLYFGGKVTINDSDAIAYNIPLDALAPDWNQSQKRRANYAVIGHAIGQWLFWAGFVWGMVMFSLSPVLINAVVLGMYVVLLFLRWLQRLRSPWGVVYDQHGRPISSAVVSVNNVNNPLVKRPPVVTNQSGRYAFLVEKGKYQLGVALKSGDSYTEQSAGPVIEVKGRQGHVSTDLTVVQDDKKL